jgi:hypothetical protein
VEYGRNKVQHKKFKWSYYQTKNFNIYYTEKTQYVDAVKNWEVTAANRADNNEAIAKFVAQVAEQELPQIENELESGLQRRANIILYNSYQDFRQTNIGQGIDMQAPGGTTKLVNNKAAVYFESDHHKMRVQVREAIARILLDNILFGESIGEVAANQALLDLPQWLTDGYVKYHAENWNTDLDDRLKSAMLGGEYRTFYQFAFDQPLLAGHSFWRYIEDNYKKENVPYFLYLTRVYKSLNSASEKIFKKKFTALLKEFMQKEGEKYYEDINRRKNTPRGKLFTMEDVSKKDLFKFQASPAPKSQDYAVIQYYKGKYKVYVVEGWVDKRLLLKIDVRTNYKEYNDQYPILAWDPKGSRLAVLYNEDGKLKLFVWDVIKRQKVSKTNFPSFDQVQDMTYYLKSNKLLFSAVRNGQSDLFAYDIDKFALEQLTNDMYADLDPNFVTFPSKTGIIFSSNRPTPEAKSADTILPGNPFNIYLIDDYTKPQFKQYSKLTNVRLGNARWPAQYNENHFTFINDEKGVTNRYAGFFNSKAAGIDTLVFIKGEYLRNPSMKEVDSFMTASKVDKTDSVVMFRVTEDSTYTFPITNYESSILETRMNGDRDNLSETRREGDYKMLYKLKVDDTKLKRRNVNIKPTAYMERVMLKDRIARGEALQVKPAQDSAQKASNDLFQTEFGDDTTAVVGKIVPGLDADENNVLKKSKKFPYKLKFNSDFLTTGFNNNVLVNRYRPYNGGRFSGTGGGNTNPNPLDAMLKVGISDLMEDYRFLGAMRTPTSLGNFEWLVSFTNFRKRLDWGFTVYRQTMDYSNAKEIGNLYQANLSYPFAETKALRANVGYRTDRLVTKAIDPNALLVPDQVNKTVLAHLEYVQDYTLNPSANIYDGMRWKMYLDGITRIDKNINGKFTYNFGADFRFYKILYRHITWANRAAADFAWGNQKIVYYLGGIDQNLQIGSNIRQRDGSFRYFNEANKPAQDQTYTYEAFAQNLRGFLMNTANGNNVVVMNTELRVPVWSTFFSRPINNAFVRNLQLVSFMDFGSAWNGKYNGIKRPNVTYVNAGSPVSVNIKVGGIGPFAGSYGFGLRSVLLGYFFRADAGWQMNGLFKGKPVYQFGTGFDF